MAFLSELDWPAFLLAMVVIIVDVYGSQRFAFGLLALVVVQQRQGRDRIQVLPAALVGSGLMIGSAVGRRRHRARLLEALRSSRHSSP